MRYLLRSLGLLFVLVAAFFCTPAILHAANPESPAVPDGATAAAPDPAPNGANLATPNAVLLNLLVSKGILTSGEADSLGATSGSADTQKLLLLLKQKGLISDSDVNAMHTAVANSAGEHTLSDTLAANNFLTAQVGAASQAAPPQPKESAGPVVIPAIAPLRVLGLDPPIREGLQPALMLGGVRVRPYGFVKSTVAYDSYDPTGDDFPRPGFTNTDSGPNSNPEFHIKARATRFGSRFEWPDPSGKVTITGDIEADFEGNFSAVDNRNVSSIRSNALQLRLAYGRIDYAKSENTDIFFEAGQDWSIFGSSALMNLLETTFFGAYWGNLYERTPQFRVGVVQKLGGSRNWKLSPEFAIMMPSEGDLPASAVTCTDVTKLDTAPTCTLINGLASQLGYAERQGADYAAPELESRVVLQFQLDKAPGVVPAQVLWSGFYTHRQATVLASAVPAPYNVDFPRGVDVSSPGYGNQFAVSLPTRWATLVASGYFGADLRFFFSGETLSYYNQPAGLTNVADGFSVDRSSTVLFGTNASGAAVTAPQKPVRGYGGFVQLGLPLSRWFNADPKGRNAGWQAYFEYGLDAAVANDFILGKPVTATTGAGPIKDSLRAFTLFYKMNNYVQFGFEEGDYHGQALANGAGICTTKVGGVPTCSSNDWRTEFGPIFTF